MSRLSGPVAALLAAVVAALAGAIAPALAGPCEEAGQAAEAKYGLPPGLLLAIGKVESGRWDSVQARLEAWPWSIDDGGTPFVLNSKQEAEQAAQALLDKGRRSIDVGCFQVNLAYHPRAFGNLSQAFDPAANADYAARFLLLLKGRLGDWPAAVAAYHSATAERGEPYRQRVLATWSGGGDGPGWPSGADGSESDRFGIHVWVPGAAGMVMASPGSRTAFLPRVITP